MAVKDLQDKVAIVTGGGTGIGRACALAFAARGARVVVNYSRSREDAEATATECRAAGGDGVAVQADVAHSADVDRLAAHAAEQWGRIDFLVNSAGTTKFAAYDDLDALTDDVWDDILGVNLKGVFFACRAVLPHMRRAGAGSIVNVGSISAIRPVGSSIPYMASKAAVHSMTQSMAVALGPEVRVNAVAPGFIETRWHAGRDEAARTTLERTPVKRNGTPEDVAEAVMYLATASFVTGEIVVVDGGRFLA
ncbi:MAG: 3-oxoacyl-[acyl-carrier protein] reductase [uncultured Chloroflexi bacterium]|uniref:3-oxoacyl-[acyl-carrier protein] reductase n=1 Tax=uncultured Chloroflexota bacterium TaxID=166587 RepID=A0A6J4J2E8_9CHLR|nr:MAG: 3-oxoacyl-[acyl-carrier protein] reductase [uncultured Chloroflexota bacterium]